MRANPKIAEMIHWIETAEADDGFVSVTPVWRGVIRPVTYSISVKKKDVARVKACMADGAFWSDATVETDIHGETYVAAKPNVIGRSLNADLKRLGH